MSCSLGQKFAVFAEGTWCEPWVISHFVAHKAAHICIISSGSDWWHQTLPHGCGLSSDWWDVDDSHDLQPCEWTQWLIYTFARGCWLLSAAQDWCGTVVWLESSTCSVSFRIRVSTTSVDSLPATYAGTTAYSWRLLAVWQQSRICLGTDCNDSHALYDGSEVLHVAYVARR